MQRGGNERRDFVPMKSIGFQRATLEIKEEGVPSEGTPCSASRTRTCNPAVTALSRAFTPVRTISSSCQLLRMPGADGAYR